MDELERLGLDDKFGLAYDNEIMQKKMINTARSWGYDDGKEDGARAKEIKKKKNLLKNEVSIDIVSESTGLSVEELNKLV